MELLDIYNSNEKVVDLGHICVDFSVKFIFYLKKDIDIKDLVLDKSEVEAMHYFSKEELHRIIKKGMMHKGHIAVLKKSIRIYSKLINII